MQAKWSDLEPNGNMMSLSVLYFREKHLGSECKTKGCAVRSSKPEGITGAAVAGSV